ncbi:glycosyltransferase family 4 protein [Lutimonas halocynthiae]|uniref:glycosyltransferase family 4 protein n=1 Tax=Lutimonas halocynthiae TaxID=1446477 RepID=UPI0025B3189E|nr:glycosyltransferase family 4 protein [Lutimonas halocynthiae]MDN3643793.1 glycosyltransferase family 4 protein [Lutimonas halocynthiae]
MSKKATLVNQVTGPLFIDIANAYISKFDEVILITGSIEPTSAELDSRIKVLMKCKYKRNKGHLRIYTWLLFFMQIFVYILFNKNHGKILFVSNPPLLPFLGSNFSDRKNFDFDVLVYDVYPDALSNFGYIKEGSLLYRLWDRMNKKVYLKATRVFTISNVMQKVISRTIEKDKVEVIYPWVDMSFIKPIEKENNWFVKEQGLLDKKVILYSGNMGITHDLMTVLKTAKKLSLITNNFHFLFIGDGAQKEKLVAYKEDNKLSNVTFLPYQASEILPFSFASADFGIVSLGKGAEGLSVPSKTFYMLATGSAIISISKPNSEVSNLLRDNSCGVSIGPSDYQSLFEFLISIGDSDLKKYKENSRSLSNHFTHKNAYKFL